MSRALIILPVATSEPPIIAAIDAAQKTLRVKTFLLSEELAEMAARDWHHSEAIDLSEEGLLADLGKRGGERGAADLVLDAGRAPHKHGKP